MADAPFPAPSSQTGHDLLDHPAFPQAVDQQHSPDATRVGCWPKQPAKLLDPYGVLAVAVAHLAKGPSLRRVVLSTPIIATTPFSDFRSALRHFTGLPLIGFAPVRHPGSAPRAVNADAETDLSCSAMDYVNVPLPLRRRVHRCRPSKLFAPSVVFAQPKEARLPLVSRSRGDL